MSNTTNTQEMNAQAMAMDFSKVKKDDLLQMFLALQEANLNLQAEAEEAKKEAEEAKKQAEEAKKAPKKEAKKDANGETKAQREERIEKERINFFTAVHAVCRELNGKYNAENQYYQIDSVHGVQLTVLIRDEKGYCIQCRTTATVFTAFERAFHYYSWHTKTGVYAQVPYNHPETALTAIRQFVQG